MAHVGDLMVTIRLSHTRRFLAKRAIKLLIFCAKNRLIGFDRAERIAGNLGRWVVRGAKFSTPTKNA